MKNAAPSPPLPAAPTLGDITAASLRIGCLGFGGPAGQIALMHRVFVEEKAWIDEARFLAALNFCMLLPGPEAQQLATYIGWRLRGVAGGLIAGVLFVLPGAAVVFALAWLYVAQAGPETDALFQGVQAAVLAILLQALVKVARRALKSPADATIAAGAFAALFVFAAPFPLVILAAAAMGLLRVGGSARGEEGADQAPERPAVLRSLATAGLWSAVWLAPLGFAALLLGPDHILVETALLFAGLAAVTFGGAYATLTYLKQQAVDVHDWLTPEQMIDGLGLAETTPGPLVLVNQFVGFLAGWQDGGGGLWLAAACAAAASWMTFAPSFLWIFAGAPHAERLRTNRWASGALAAVGAAVIGVIANLALWFALQVLFGRSVRATGPMGISFDAPDLASFDAAAGGLALLAAVALLRFEVNIVLVIVGCALPGLILARL